MSALEASFLYYTDEQGLKTKSATETAPCILCMVDDLGEATHPPKSNGAMEF